MKTEQIALRPMTRLAHIEMRDGPTPEMNAASTVDAQANSANETIEFTFSSEEPYDRGWGIEVLGHGAKEVDMTWMASGRAPLLVDHETDVDSQVGIIERAWIENGRGKAVARLGKSDRARDIAARIKDGQLVNVSVGYRINEMVLQSQAKDREVYRVTGWKPFEASLVTIPADTTVGVGRAEAWGKTAVIITKDMTMTKETPQAAPEKPAVNPEDILKAERQRISEISAIGTKFNMADIAQKAIGQGLSADQFRGEVLAKLGDSAETVLRNQNSIGLSTKEQQSFSFLKAMRALAFPNERKWRDAAKFEFECSQAFGERTGQEAKGFLIPTDVAYGEPSAELKRALQPYMKRDLNVASGSQGGFLVSTETLTGSFIELLRANMVLDAAGVITLGNLVGNVSIPRDRKSVV